MRIKRSLLVVTMLGALAGCESMNGFLDSVMSPSEPNSSTNSSNLPANIPSAPPPDMPKPGQTATGTATTPRVASSLVVYVGSTVPINGYTLVQQKGQSIYVDPHQTLVYRDLSNALAMADENNRPYTDLVFSAEGRQKLAQLTRNNSGKSLVVTMNNELISIIRIAQPVTQGVIHVPMNSVQDAQAFERRILDGE